MKKLVILGLIVLNMFMLTNTVFAVQDDEATKRAIEKYKERNFIGCISDFKIITEKDPSNVVGWYYLGNSYMNIALKAQAHQAFDKVVQLNSVPQLTSYSIQAKLCMENPARCDYQNLSLEEIDQLKVDPSGFLDKYMADKMNTGNTDFVEIDKLIEGDYNQIHPEAQEFIDQEKLKMQQTEININQAYLNRDYQVAQMINMMQQQNNDLSKMTMLMNNNQPNNSYGEVLNYVEKNQDKNSSAQMVQMMLMQNSMMGL